MSIALCMYSSTLHCTIVIDNINGPLLRVADTHTSLEGTRSTAAGATGTSLSNASEVSCIYVDI